MSALSALCLDWMAGMGPLFMDRTGVLLGIEAGMVNEILSNDPYMKYVLPSDNAPTAFVRTVFYI